MDVNFENLNKITDLVAQISELKEILKEGKIKKRWLNSEEAAYYLGYTISKIHDLTISDWEEGIHYHKPSGRKIFDSKKLDEWVQYGSDQKIKESIDSALSDIVLKSK